MKRRTEWHRVHFSPIGDIDIEMKRFSRIHRLSLRANSIAHEVSPGDCPMRLALAALLPVLLTGIPGVCAISDRGSGLTRVGTLSWTDVAGKAYTAKDLAKGKATVFLFVSIQCPVANIYTPRIVDLSKSYQSKGVRFYLVDSNSQDSATAVAK